MSHTFNEHFSRIRSGMNDVYGLSNLSHWIAKYTKLDDKQFSFLDHEYQQYIIDDPTKTLYVVKCAQVGLSEIFARWATAAAATQRNFTIIWTFPTTTDAEKFTKARLDPFIQSSPELARMISKAVDSTDLKKFGKNTFIYIRGTISETGALSVPADLLIHDEYDRSDMDNISAYVSRLQHKPTKMRRIFSTPTVAKYGIHKESETAKRYKQLWRCNHCRHYFLPDFENHIIIPGWDRPKKEINKSNIKNIKYDQAYLACPRCGKNPDGALDNRIWACENNSENYPSKAIFVSPFCAPRILTPSYLVKAVSDFDKWSEFKNQVLGEVAEDLEDMLTESNVRNALVDYDLKSSELHSLGIDVGNQYHFTVVREASDGTILLVHREPAHFSQFNEVKSRLTSQYRIASTVMDMNPHTPTVKAMTDYDPNAYGAEYVDQATTQTHWIKEQEENSEKAQEAVRTVKINRSLTFDLIMQLYKERKIRVHKQDDFEEFVSHSISMKRIKKFDKYGGMVYRWVKTDGVDHWHHSLAYAIIASKLRSIYSMSGLDMGSMVMTMKSKDKIPSLLTSITQAKIDGQSLFG